MTLPTPPGITPKPWQQAAFEAAKNGFRTYKRILVSAATGTGKGTLLAGMAAASKGPVLVTTERIELVEDLYERTRQLVPTSIVGDGHEDWSGQVVIASAPSLTPQRLQRAPRFKLVIGDEAHHLNSPTHRRYLDHFATYTLGLTATPFLSAPKGATTGLGSVFQALVYEYPIGDAIRNGDLCQIIGRKVRTKVDLTGIGDDWESAALTRAIDVPDRNRLAVEVYRESYRNRPTLVFATTVEHAQHLSEAFAEAGINAPAAWGSMPNRAEVLQGFRSGLYPVLCSVDLIREGFDAPLCSGIINARPTQSRIVFIQMLGRGLRTLGIPGHLTGEERRLAVQRSSKPNCLYTEIVDLGCRMTLDSAVDLSFTTEPDSRAWRVGDFCVRRHHDLVGVILQIESDRKIAFVEWTGGARSWHPLAELDRPRTNVEDLGLLKAEPAVHGGKTFPIYLLGGQRAEDPIAFFEYQKTLTAAGKNGRDWYSAHIADGELWTRINQGDPVLAGRHETREEAIRAGQRWLRERKAVQESPEGPLTGRTRGLLKHAGVTRPKDDMSEAEGLFLIAAKQAYQAVRDHKRDSCACGGMIVLKGCWRCEKCGKLPPQEWKPPRVWEKTTGGKPTGIERRDGLRAKDARVIDVLETRILQGYRHR